jgi:hypothetical protein
MTTNKILFTFMVGFTLIIGSCKKNCSTTPSIVQPTKMKITGINLDSAFQISNPMSFVIKVQSSTVSFQTSSYYLPFSNSPWYPSGIWQGLDQTFDVASQITISVFFQLPGSSQLYPEGNYSVFNFRPDNKIGTTLNNSPSTLSFINSSPGVVSTKITISVIWQ